MANAKAKRVINLGMKDPITLLHPSLITPRKFKKNGKEIGEPKYWANFLMPLDSDNAKELKAEAISVAQEEWPGVDLKTLNFPFENGDKKAKKSAENGKSGKFYEGNMFLKTSSNEDKAPTLVVAEANGARDATDMDSKNFYGGALVANEIVLQAYDAFSDDGKAGVTAYINVVCFRDDGPKLGGKDHSATFANVRGKEVDTNPLGDTAFDDDLDF